MDRPVVISDVDGVLRAKKGSVGYEIEDAVRSFCGKGGIFIMITGAPSSHVPTNLPAHIVLAEAGGIMQMVEEGGLRKFQPGVEAVNQLKSWLGINPKWNDGLAHIDGESVIIEGPRETSLTFLVGNPPHYEGLHTSISLRDLKRRVDLAIQVQSLPLTVSLGEDTTYEYMDVFSMTKARVLNHLIEQTDWRGAYLLGDGQPELEAMMLLEVIPVGFSNSIEKIRALARERGVFIDLPGPEGGVVEFFRQLKSGKI